MNQAPVTVLDLLPRVAPWLLAILGSFIGSFLNVCIHRMPDHKSVVFPGSACPKCGAPIRPWNNIPVVSWFVLRGRCASCRAPISFRYPFIEALTGALFVAAWARFGPTLALAEALVLLPALVVLFFTDLDERILPDLVTLPVAAAGLAFSPFRTGTWLPWSEGQPHGNLPPFLVALGTALAGASAFWLLGRSWRLFRPGIDTAIGFGDVKLMAMIGAFLGPVLALLTVFLGSLAGTLLFLFSWVVSSVLGGGIERVPGPLRPLARGLESAGFLHEGRGAGMLDLVPFGSMLAAGAAIALFFGERIVRFYLAVSGLAG
jgi:leader peptidase (prepilin peptidase) / N-methyltransferase